MEKRALLRSAALAAVVAFTAGCESKPVPTQPIKSSSEVASPVVIIPTVTPFPWPRAEGDSNIDKYYPELKGHPLKEKITVATQQGIVTLYNFAPVDINPDAARITFNYFEGFMTGREMFPSSWENWPFYINPKRRTPQPSIPFFIVPDDVKPPFWSKPNNLGATKIEEGRAVASFVKSNINPTPVQLGSSFSTQEDTTNNYIAVERCQGAVKVETNYLTDQPIPSGVYPANLQDDAQENFCNVQGYYFSHKQSGAKYSDIKPPKFLGIKSTPMVVSETQYNFIPKIPKIVSVK